jgi:AraC family transcriptional regulator of adaptative response/methylated-DNA-[protein]-cysteine methyltransferase
VLQTEAQCREEETMPVVPTTTNTAVADGFVSDEARWAAVAGRDAAADGCFYYAVATTGVYCRPSCPSRSARRENVSFHASPADAERAGFRPCKRCRPNEASLAERRAAAVGAACRGIERALTGGEEVPQFAELAAEVGLSRFHFHRIFREATGVTPRRYAAALRAERMRRELSDGTAVTQAIYAAGYGSSSRFYETATAQLGMTASAYRHRGRGAVIRFAVGDCSLGRVLAAATDKGIAAILLGDDDAALAAELRRRFTNAEIVAGDAVFGDHLARVIALIEAPGRPCTLPLDVRGTAFQHRVWQALRQIPPGTTATYGEIATAIGAPQAVRAVAAACAANPAAVAIPCHRVVRADGHLAGYRWGLDRKRTLLEREAAKR